MILALIVFTLVAALSFIGGLFLGMHDGYKSGVRETVMLNDASYRARAETDTNELGKRASIETNEVKSRYTHQLEEMKRLGFVPIGSVLASNLASENVNTTATVKKDSGGVILWPDRSTDKEPQPA